MASDVNIPGSELKEAQDMLGFVHDFIDIGHHTFDFDAAFGPELPTAPHRTSKTSGKTESTSCRSR